MSKKIIIALSVLALVFTSCGNYSNVLRADDYDYRYEAAKEYYAAGEFSHCYQVLEDMILLLKATDKGEESLYMLAMCYYNLKYYESASDYFERYYQSYPKGTYTELSRFYAGLSAYKQSPDSRLDQSSTYTALNCLNEYLQYYPNSPRREEVTDMIYQLQERLAQKEYESARLYYNLGNYTGNCIFGGNNFDACIITAENTLKQYPYTRFREELMMLILRSRYKLALNSIESKAEERYRATIDEYYGFKNEFPESKYIKEADKMFRTCSEKVKM
ncbi:MAG: outer membrane protein assembly factor BamD [Bacteroidaceae bacterium]|nr:outer membrane protein assembly factor BamD [Bacteroidaceae bacterium]MBR6892701.1 outer membrane protein assembly factor BamD [Bacteroidaceae bacterium]